MSNPLSLEMKKVGFFIFIIINAMADECKRVEVISSALREVIASILSAKKVLYLIKYLILFIFVLLAR